MAKFSKTKTEATPEKVDTVAVSEKVKIKIKRVAKGAYNGFDGKDPVVDALSVKSGETVLVTESKAEQLMADYPNQWELV